MNEIVTKLANTLQFGFQKIAELSQANKTASAPSFDKAKALVAATDACRKLAHLNLMSADTVDDTAATLVSDHEAALQMFSEYVGALHPSSVADATPKQSSLGSVASGTTSSTEQRKPTRLRC